MFLLVFQARDWGKFIIGCSSVVGKGFREEYEWPYSSGFLVKARIGNRECISATSILRKMWIKKIGYQRPQLEGSGFSLCFYAQGWFYLFKGRASNEVSALWL